MKCAGDCDWYIYGMFSQNVAIMSNFVWKNSTYLNKSLRLYCPNEDSRYFFFCGAATQRWSWFPHSWGFLDHTQRRTTVGRTPLDEWSARRRDHLPDNTQHSQQTNIHAPGGIRTHDLSRRAAADLRLRPRDDWDRPFPDYKQLLQENLRGIQKEHMLKCTNVL